MQRSTIPLHRSHSADESVTSNMRPSGRKAVVATKSLDQLAEIMRPTASLYGENRSPRRKPSKNNSPLKSPNKKGKKNRRSLSPSVLSGDYSHSGDASSLDFRPTDDESSLTESDPHVSSSTMAHSNKSDKKRKNASKTHQLIESIVWFSFHIPRTVLEDLIAHELELWNKKHKESSRMSKRRLQVPVLGSDDENSISSASGVGDNVLFGTNFSEKLIRQTQSREDMFKLPKAIERQSALLFVDMSGFTKLSTMLDLESLSVVINKYFDMIVAEVIEFGGDILKFAGDAFFAEWRVMEDSEDDEAPTDNPLSDLNASLVSINEMMWDTDVPPLSHSVMMAARCSASIVRKFSDYHVKTADGEALLNVHAGIGVGELQGLHVGDFKEGDEDGGVEARREFLLLGEPIDQISNAMNAANAGQVMASPKALMSLAFCCELNDEQRLSNKPVCIAARDHCYLRFDLGLEDHPASQNALQPYESLRMHCKALNHTALRRLNLQMALYVHPVIRADELALSAAIQSGKISQPTETLQSRHRAEAELRSVYTMFISPLISYRITGIASRDAQLYKLLQGIMHVTSRELDRYAGHLRQFIVDDKGVVLICTWGLRGSCFANMVDTMALPATFAIQRALLDELKVESRIGATFGKVYCGVVGGVRRHEFAAMGAPVNLAARLMSSKENKGILVDEAVKEQCRGSRYTFNSLPPVKAKGYEKPVPILEPIVDSKSSSRKKKSAVPFIGRSTEKNAIMSIARGILEEPECAHSTMIFLTGESGFGKTALAMHVLDELKATPNLQNSAIIVARSTSTETEQRIPLSSFRKILIGVIRDRCQHDGDDERTLESVATSPSLKNLKSIPVQFAMSRRSRLLASRNAAGNASSGGTKKLLSIRNGLGSTVKGGPLRGSIYSRNESLSQSLHGAIHSNGDRRKSRRRQSRRISTARRSSVQVKREGNDQHSVASSPTKSQSSRFLRARVNLQDSSKTKLNDDDDRSDGSESAYRQSSTAMYFEKLCWACEKLDYPFEYADIVGSQFLGFENATPITHVNGHVPTMEELVEFLALAFVCIVDFSKLTTIFIDDFQYADSFSWNILQTIIKRSPRVLLLCAIRSHDKQALRRITSAALPDNKLQAQMIEVSLGPLDFNDIRELISNLLIQKKTAIPDSLCDDIFQRTGGLPVYVVELLENIKRTKTLHLVDGMLQWTEAGLRQKKKAEKSKTVGAVMEEAFLSRFDFLDVRARKVLQTCAVLGLNFALSDVVQVHPEIEAVDIEIALDAAVEELILVEHIPDSEELESVLTDPTAFANESMTAMGGTSSSSGTLGIDRYYHFSHAMWRDNVLATMLKERRIELHRLVAESMEEGDVLVLEESDISRLLTLFDHWKACGDFIKVAPLALTVGARLEEWLLSSQSLELYEDALDMVFGGVEALEDEDDGKSEWVKVKARPIVLDLILRLHICAGLCYQRLGNDEQSILYFEDAHNIIKTASKRSGISKSLAIPIISSLCVLKIAHNVVYSESTLDLGELIEEFIAEAKGDGRPIHIGRALSMKATFLAKQGHFGKALETADIICESYDVGENSSEMVMEYGREFAIECFADSVRWLFQLGMREEALDRIGNVIELYLPLMDPDDIDALMYVLLPIIQVLCLVGRPEDAGRLLKQRIINPYHDSQLSSDYWAPLFNPLAYLVDSIRVSRNAGNLDSLVPIEHWILTEDSPEVDQELQATMWVVMGHLCCVLSKLNLPSKRKLTVKAREFLLMVARSDDEDLFQKIIARDLLESIMY